MDFGKLNYIGHIPDIPFGEILYSLQVQKETGLLYVRRDKIAKRIYFNRGRLIHAESPLVREQSITALIQHQLLDIPAGIDILERSVESGTHPETLLMNEGQPPEEKIAEVLRQLIRERLLEVFAWQDGQFAFFFDKAPSQKDSLLPSPFTLEEFILDGLKKYFTKDRLKALVIDDLDEVWRLHVPAEEIQKKMNLRAPEMNLIKRIDGKYELERILYSSRMEMQSTLALLLAMKILRYTASASMDESSDQYEIPTSSNLSLDEISYAQRLVQTGPALLDLPPFELLQVGRSFTDNDLRKGYYQLAQRYHQREIIEKFPESLVQLSNRIFERISNSFEALLQVEKAHRDKSLEIYNELDGLLFDDEQNLHRAMIPYLQGRLAYDETRYDLALGLFNESIQIFPNESELRTYKALSILKKDSSDFIKAAEDSIQELKRAQNIDSRFVPIFQSMGEAYEAMGKRDLANQCYRDALILSPDNSSIRKLYRNTKEPFTLDIEEQIQRDDGTRKETEEKLRAFLNEYEKSTYFEILGITEEANANEVRHAYFRLAKDYHPDRMGSMKNHPLAEEVFLKINQAYDILSSDKKRRFYVRSLRSKEREVEFKQSQRHLKTEKMFTKAKSLLNDGKYDEAFELFRSIDQERQGCHMCKAYIGYTLFSKDIKTNPNIYLEAEKYFEQSLDLDPDFLEAYVLWGKMYRQLNQFTKAVRYFQKVLDQDPDNVEALREIRLINQRRQQQEKETAKAAQTAGPASGTKAAQEKKGLFESIFGRKK